IFPVVIVALLIGIFKKVNIKPILGLLTLNVLFSAIYALWYWEGTRVLKDNIMLFNTFNFSRIHFLKPLIWYMLFVLALFLIWKTLRLIHLILFYLFIIHSYLFFVDLYE